MQIPIQNIYYLLCYAWDKLDEQAVVNVDATSSPGLADLFARVLTNGVNHLLRRGFDRGYIGCREWTVRPRGRIEIQDYAKSGGSVRTSLPCSYDEFSHDVAHNRILKATMVRLLKAPHLEPRTAEGLGRIVRMFSEITDVPLSAELFGKVVLHRNNHFYDFLLRVCELILWCALPTETPGYSKFRDFVRDERQLAVLYEAFLRNFYRRETTFTVGRQNIIWRWQAVDSESDALLPRMQTDISLQSESRQIIIECKFTPEATQRHFAAEKLRSGHLYQVHAYLSNLPPGPLTDTCRVILLYPTVGEPVRAEYADGNRSIHIRTLNLDQDWKGIHSDLLSLVA